MSNTHFAVSKLVLELILFLFFFSFRVFSFRISTCIILFPFLESWISFLCIFLLCCTQVQTLLRIITDSDPHNVSPLIAPDLFFHLISPHFNVVHPSLIACFTFFMLHTPVLCNLVVIPFINYISPLSDSSAIVIIDACLPHHDLYHILRSYCNRSESDLL